MASYSFNIGSTGDLETDLALIDVGGADAGTGNTYTFTFTQSVTLNQQLYAVNLAGGTAGGDTLAINGNNATLSGNNQFNGLFVYAGTVDVNNLTIANAVAAGGAGGNGTLGGGGGAGLGGGLFVASGGAATLTNVGFTQDAAKGGSGGGQIGGGLEGGGGGLGGPGGPGIIGGGGGVGLAASGGGGGSAGGAGIVRGAAGGAAGAGSGGAGGASGGGGGAGGIGGGGGGGVGAISIKGGFGGGGGGAGSIGAGGTGGFGGGGGGGGLIGGFGGFGGGGAGGSGGGGGGFGAGSGGTGGEFIKTGGGGGGLGAGGDIFVQQGGSLTIAAGSLAAGSVTGGTAGVGGTAGAGLGSSLFIQGNQTVTLAPGAGKSLTVSGTIADETGSEPSLIAGQGVSNGDGTTGGAGGLAVTSGTVTLSGANTYTGGTQLTGGEVVVGSATALGSGTLAMSPGTTLGFSGNYLVANAITVSGDPTFDVAAGQGETLLGVIADGGTPGAVEKTGAGTLALTGANTYSGGTTIAGGTLVDAPATGGTSSIGTGAVTFAGTLASPATLLLASGAQPGNDGTFANTLVDFGYDDALDLQALTFSTATGDGVSYDAGTGVLSVTESGTTEDFTLSQPSSTTFAATNDGAGGTEIVATGPVCFVTGTRIRTTRGEVPVEDLVVGDRAVTVSGTARPIVWIGHRTLACGAGASELRPIRIAAHAFGPDIPARDLLLSPGHPVLVGADADGDGGHLVPIMCLVNGTTVRCQTVDRVTYWHVELDAHDILLADNLPAESYLDWGDRGFFADGADGLLANPDWVVPGLSARCRPVALDGPIVEAERHRLDAVFVSRLAGACAWPAPLS